MHIPTWRGLFSQLTGHVQGSIKIVYLCMMRPRLDFPQLRGHIASFEDQQAVRDHSPTSEPACAPDRLASKIIRLTEFTPNSTPARMPPTPRQKANPYPSLPTGLRGLLVALRPRPPGRRPYSPTPPGSPPAATG